tara:strand:+ start:1226 stop:1471 length:246 start_codon:yes stop_codon:yes gene_type:complete
MSFTKSKSTKRFSFDISRNPTSKKAGSNVVTIATNPIAEGRYSYGGTQMTMTVREAQALQSFLNQNLASHSMSQDSTDEIG